MPFSRTTVAAYPKPRILLARTWATRCDADDPIHTSTKPPACPRRRGRKPSEARAARRRSAIRSGVAGEIVWKRTLGSARRVIRAPKPACLSRCAISAARRSPSTGPMSTMYRRSSGTCAGFVSNVPHLRTLFSVSGCGQTLSEGGAEGESRHAEPPPFISTAV